MLETSILTILACPVCKEPLETITPDLLLKIIQFSNNTDRTDSIEGGLLCRKHNHVFVIQQDIPILLFNESISMAELGIKN